jgi:hypothetical protein
MSNRILLVVVWSVVAVMVAAGGWAAPALGEPAAGFAAAPAQLTGRSPDGLGDWQVHYQRVVGGDPAAAEAMNGIIDAEARGQVLTYEPSATKTQPWTLNIDGKLLFEPMTVSALFTGTYDTDFPNMPIEAVATRVFDNRSGILLTWDNLFTDRRAGLTRLSEATRQILPTVYRPPSRIGVWQFGSEIAPVDANFKYWVPSAQGIDLYFPDGQFGRGVATITVPWTAVADLIAPEFAPIIPGHAA